MNGKLFKHRFHARDGFVRRKGMSLVELLVVVAILGLLAVTVAPNITGTIDRARSRDTVRGIGSFIARAQSRAFNAEQPKGFIIQPISNPPIAVDMFFADSPPDYAGETVVTTADVEASGGDPRVASLTYSDTATQSRIANGGFVSPGDSIQFEGRGLWFPLGPWDPIKKKSTVTMRGDGLGRGQNPFNTVLPLGRGLPFRIRRKPFRASTGIFQCANGTAIDLRWCTLGGRLFSDFMTFSGDNTPEIVVLYDKVGRPFQLLHSGGRKEPVAEPIFLLVGLVDLCGNDVVPVSDAEQAEDVNFRKGANFQYADAFWLVIDPNAGVVRSSRSAASEANSMTDATAAEMVIKSQYNIRIFAGLL